MKTKDFLPDTPKKIGVMVSGGFDSAVLLYLLISENIQKASIHEIIAMTVPTGDNANEHSDRIIKHISHRFGVKIPHIEISSSNTPIHSSMINEVLNNKVDIAFSGSTDVPTELVSSISPIRLAVPPEFTNILHVPWAATCKNEIVKFAIDNQLTDIINLSHSCARRDIHINRCGHCYNCIERKWAFEKNNFIDTGNN
jgi:7-cyano-7-deazaguanine synthase in queuosine biosynthesis